MIIEFIPVFYCQKCWFNKHSTHFLYTYKLKGKHPRNEVLQSMLRQFLHFKRYGQMPSKGALIRLF